MKRFVFWIVWPLVLFSVQARATESDNSIFELTKHDIVLELTVTASGPDFLVGWRPIEKPREKSFVYLVFSQKSNQHKWSYLGYSDFDTCFVHYGATLFYPEITYEVHVYYGSLRALPGFPRDPQDPRFPGEAFYDFW